MKRLAITTAAALALAALTGCPSGPTSLWLAPNNSEVVIQLIDHEPPPW